MAENEIPIINDNEQVSRSRTDVLKFGDDVKSGESLHWCDYLSEDETIIVIASGFRHSAMLCSSGHVYVFGSNFIRDSISNLEPGKPVLVTFHEDTRIIDVACGCETTFFLTDIGGLFACGLNHRGQLGVHNFDDQFTPIQVTDIPPIMKISAGMCQTIALAVNGDVYAAGFSVGMGSLSSFTRLFNANSPFVDVSCGGFHYAGLSEDGLVFVIGNNSVGELGSGENPNQCNALLQSLKPVSLPMKVSAIACGMFHTVALTVDGTAWSWGFNAHGQLGVGTNIDCFVPTRMIGLESHVIKNISAGGHHSSILTDKGIVLMCGRGDDGELVQVKTSLNVMMQVQSVSAPSNMAVKQVACSWSYTLMLVVFLPKPKIELDNLTKLTESESDILASLKCPVCCRVMCGPIYRCAKGHNICNACRLNTNNAGCPSCDKLFLGARNYALENLAKGLKLQCPACFERMPINKLDIHNNACPKRMHKCPVQTGCGWSGRPQSLLIHATTVHKDNTWRELPHLFVHDTDGEIETNVLSAFGQVFVLHRKFNRTSQVFKAVLQFIGLMENAKQFKFELEFITLGDDRNYTFRKDICSDIQNVDDVLRSDNCISLEKKRFYHFFIDNLLVCKVNILKTECCNRFYNIKALVEHQLCSKLKALKV